MLRAVAKRLGLNDAELKELQNAAYKTWQAIGYDVLQVEKQQGEPALMTRKEVLEIVLDASHIEANNRLSESVRKALHDGSHEDKLKAIRPAFPYALYGE